MTVVASPPAAASHATDLAANLVAEYRRRGWWRDEDLWTSFEKTANAHASGKALIAADASLTFAELRERAAGLSAALQRHGVQRGDVVVIHGRNNIDSTVALLACAHAGAVMTPLPPMYSVAQLHSVFASARPRAVIASGHANEIETCAQAVEQHGGIALFATSGSSPVRPGARLLSDLRDEAPTRRDAVPADALALLVYSSGTTGAPKGVMHCANTARYAIEQRAALHHLRPGEVSLVVAQFGFVGSIVFGHLMGALTGACLVLMDHWNGDEAVKLIATHRIGYTLMMPTHVHDLLSSPLLDQLDVSSLRRAAMGGLTRERRLEMRRRLCPPLPAYGMSECLGFTSCDLDDPSDKAVATEGHPFAGTEAYAEGEEGQRLPAGETGPLLVRGPSRFLGYHNAPELTREAVTDDGFYRTGDVGWIDADGYVTFVAREKDIIRRGGVTIVPGDLEAALSAHPRIEHIAVVALPDARLGERACACVISRDGAPVALQDLTAFLQERGVARYTWPERVEMFTSFPRSASLKVQKPALVQQIVQRTGA